MRSLRIMGAAAVAAIAIFPLAPVPAAAAATGYTGIISDEAGVPIEGACLTPFDWHSVAVTTFCTDADGRYLITGLDTRPDYRVRIEAEGFRTRWWQDAPDLLNADRLYMPSSWLVERNFTLGTGAGSITGRVLGLQGEPDDDTTVTLSAVDSWWEASAYTSDLGDGRFRIDNVPPGQYRVSVYREDRGLQWVPGRDIREDGQVLDVTDGEVLTVDERWLPGGSVRAVVRDEATGALVPRPCLRIDSTPAHREECGADGVVVYTPTKGNPPARGSSTALSGSPRPVARATSGRRGSSGCPRSNG